MIKLNISIYDQIKQEYITQIYKKINKSYTQSTKQYFSINVKDFFETDDEINKDKIVNILLMDFSDLDNNDELCINYLKTGLLVYASDFDIDRSLIKEGLPISDSSKSKFRRNFVQKYLNDWILPYVKKHPNFYLNDDNFNLFINEIKKEYIDLSNEIAKIIKYKFINTELRHKIITSSGITVCPYCDRQFISYFENKKKTTADLDHFLPNKKFTLFSLSLYNFIPSCQVCNQRFKKDKVKDILYPFKAGFENDAKFELTINQDSNIGTFYGFNSNFDLKINVSERAKQKTEILNSIELFNLESLYEHHKTYVMDLLLKNKLIYSNDYLNMIKDEFQKLELSKEQLNTFLYGYSFNNELDNNKILKKLTKDILKIID